MNKHLLKLFLLVITFMMTINLNNMIGYAEKKEEQNRQPRQQQNQI